MKTYDHTELEPKWQQKWQEAGAFKAPELQPGERGEFILDMFPYPSAAGLHVGHLLGYTGSDIVARVARMQGKKVLHPMGWDAFGLPAENYALKTGVHPSITTEQAIPEYKRQLTQAGMGYDWSKEMNSSSPEYYKWTQWLFTFLYKRGLAYRKDGMVNWCPKDQTVLANEQVVGGRCERCGTEVEQRDLKQWYFKITDYADRLIDDLDGLDWPERIKTMQKNWIGRSEGARVSFAIGDKAIEVFTTRVDTIFGATYLVLAPEHSLVAEIVTNEQRAEVEAYQIAARKKSELERLHLDKSKTGVFTGAYATNPATGEQIPVWVADYVLATYGTGAIMAVPAHDERDKEFAEVFNLPIKQVIDGDTLIESGEFTGKTITEAVPAILEKIGAKKETTYRLRDWLVSRQRYWGAPIPVAYDAAGNEHLIPDDQLPVELPTDVAFSPTGESPLASAAKWREVTVDGQTMTREADTLDTFVCSSWYFLRFPNPDMPNEPFDKEAVKKWLPVDTYVGGAEHAVLHLLYSRFITKVFFDAGMIDFKEPFMSLHNQGMILGPDHNKMSKSKGNVISPDEVVAEYGADTMRAYEMFMGPFEQEKPWSTEGIVGVRRFLEKVWKLQEICNEEDSSYEENRILHFATRKITDDISHYRFNTCISTLMESVNKIREHGKLSKLGYMRLITLLSPFAPHITEEIWQDNNQLGFCSLATWPEIDYKYLNDSSWTGSIQINGKVWLTKVFSEIQNEAEIEAQVRSMEGLEEKLAGRKITRIIVVPGKVVSIVAD